MSKLLQKDKEYISLLTDIKSKIRGTQIKATLAVNAVLINFYWELGKMIVEKQEKTSWGDSFLSQLSKDLKIEFPEMSGFSLTNLKYCRSFYKFYSGKSQIGQRAVDQFDKTSALPAIRKKGQQSVDPSPPSLALNLPWGTNVMIFTQAEDLIEAEFYLTKTVDNNWSRDVLALQIKSQLFQRQGKAITNFKKTLPEPLSDLAQQTLKDPYIFDFLTLAESVKERDVENQLLDHLTKFLLELGKGFAFVGKQYRLEIGKKEFPVDLLFYHIPLKCYVVIELKNTAFAPEYTGKLNFYLSAIDDLLTGEEDRPSIGILLCRDKETLEVEYALKNINKPIGVSEFQFTKALPRNLKSSLPTVEEFEREMKKLKG